MHHSVEGRIGVRQFVDDQKFTPYHFLIFTACAICLLIDGFDSQAMGYVGPALKQALGLSAASLGPTFSASLIGSLIGAMALGVAGDRVGRKPVIIGALIVSGLLMCGTAAVETINELIAARFATGMGLGTLLPTTLALASEFTPSRYRSTLVMLMSIAYVAGAALGGVIAAPVITHFGWQWVFIGGGAISVLIALVAWAVMPESIQFLAATEKGAFERTTAIARRLSGNATLANVRWFYEVPAELAMDAKARNWTGLFRGGLAVTTVLFWALNISNLLCVNLLANWLPTLVRQEGLSMHLAVVCSAVMQSGGIPGTILLGFIAKRFDITRVLAVNFLAGAIALGLLGSLMHSDTAVLMTVIFVAGFCVVGGQSGVNALGARCYPTFIRTTGMGWALGIGRTCSSVGPLLGGALLSAGLGAHSVFVFAAIAGAISTCAIFVLGLGGRVSESVGPIPGEAPIH